MRLATYNVESLFDRAKAMNLPSWKDGASVLEDFARINSLIQQPQYSAQTKADILQIAKKYKGLTSGGASTYICLRENRGKLFSSKGKNPAIAANGRGDWLGWFELETDAVKDTATDNTARVIGLVKADVQCVIEAEDRRGLKLFDEQILPPVNVTPFEHVMLIDGNDDRGIDVGVMTKRGYEIVRIVSHVDDTDTDGLIFSRDCAEYELRTPKGSTLLLLVNHFKSKGYGNAAESAAKRLRQAKRVRAIYDERIKSGYEYIAVLGDLNETPDAPPMDPLIREGSTLVDVMVHPKFLGDGRPGTHGNGTASSKLDYILMSPELSSKVTSAGIERRGVWGGKNGNLFPHLATMKSSRDAASDHAALWADLDI